MRTFFKFIGSGGLCVCLATVGLLGCGGDNSPTMTPDLAAATLSCCGKPGDAGNSKGVGKYCTDPNGGECRSSTPGVIATICSVIGDTVQRKTTFCTVTCKPEDVGYCGEGASCTMDSATKVYGCTPNLCTTNPPAGCSA